jgi:UDP-N-acetylmuramoyl-tripeptide--D-alanyl-D-alanine ligase
VGKLSADGTQLEIDQEKYELPLPGRHNALNLLAAISIAQSVSMTPEEIRAGLTKFEGAEGRSQIKKLKNGATFLCDYYNANPTSTEAAFELLTQIAHATPDAPKKLVAVLADMLELGPTEEHFHRSLAPSLVRLGFSEVYLFGPRMKWLLDELKLKHFSGLLKHFETQDLLLAALRDSVRTGSAASSGIAVLIKGSHSMKMENIWKKLESADL